jgi:hypothetical protein
VPCTTSGNEIIDDGVIKNGDLFLIWHRATRATAEKIAHARQKQLTGDDPTKISASEVGSP